MMKMKKIQPSTSSTFAGNPNFVNPLNVKASTGKKENKRKRFGHTSTTKSEGDGDKDTSKQN